MLWQRCSKRVFVCGLAAALIVVACKPSRKNEIRLKVGYIPIADCTQLFVAISNGYFRDEHLQVDLVSMPGGAPILEALGAKHLDVGFSNLVSLMLARQSGLRLRAISGGPAEDSLHKEHALLVPSSSSIRNLRDLRGQRIAVNTRRNIDELMLRRLLQQAAIDSGSVRFVEVPFPRMLAVLSSGGSDVAAVIEPFVTFGVAGGSYRVMTYNYVAVQPVTEISTFVVRDEWLDQHSTEAAGFARALRRAAQFANSNPDSVRVLLTRYTSLKQEQLAGITLPLFTDTLSTSRLRVLSRHLTELGWLTKPMPDTALMWRVKAAGQ